MHFSKAIYCDLLPKYGLVVKSYFQQSLWVTLLKKVFNVFHIRIFCYTVTDMTNYAFVTNMSLNDLFFTFMTK